MTARGLLWEGDPYRAKLWASVPGATSGEVHLIPEEDAEAHIRSWRCPCGPALEYVGPGWMWTHEALDGRPD